MKPIALKLSGLQSYRELQEVDFTRLCDAGVFGIFGPTGSGKSSILDAITLALYSKVERASNGTQGIMNHAENTLFVAFTFELTDAAGPMRYRVERQFKRSNELSISNTLSRFIHVRQEGDVVLADKQGDVNQHVHELLGLSIDDFTRAVVLPQGKFAEFLYLKGKERRQMLQRLFHLEQYGDQLQIRLSQRSKDTEIQIKEITAEQQGLGDASKPVLKEAEERLIEAKGAAENKRILLLDCEKNYKKKQQIWEWQEQKKHDEILLQKLGEQEPHILQFESKIQQADQAERLRPYLEQWDSTAGKYKEYEGKHLKAEADYEYAAKQHKDTNEQYDQARLKLQSNESNLLVKLNNYQQALDLEKETKELKKVIEEQKSIGKKGSVQLKTSGEDLQKEREILKKAVDKQTDLKNKLKEVEVPAPKRKTIQSAYNDKQEISSMHKNVLALAEERKVKDTELRELEKAVKSIQEKQDSSSNGLQQRVLRLQGDLQRLFQAEDILINMEHSIPDRIEEILQENRQNEEQQRAAHLAANLIEGKPCPVCGSEHHPHTASNPIKTVVGEDDLKESTVKPFEVLLASVRELQFDIKQNKLAAHSLIEQVEELAVELIQDEAAVALQAPQLKSISSSIDRDALRSEYNKVQTDTKAITVKLHNESNQIKMELQHHKKLLTQIQGLSSEIKAFEGVSKSIKEKEKTKQEELQQKQDAWKTKFSDFNLEQMDEEYRKLDNMDQQSEEFKERIKTSVDFIEQKQRNIEELQNSIRELEKQQFETETTVNNMKLSLDEKSHKLYSWVGEETAEKLIFETQSFLKKLRENEHQAKQNLDEAQKHLQSSGNLRSATSQDKTTAEQNVKQAEKQWKEILEKTEFSSDQEVRAAFISEETRIEISNEIKNHREQEKQLGLQIKQLERNLSNETLSSEEWEHCRQKLDLAKQEDEIAIQQRAKAERDWEELQKKHQRWMELEGNREVRQEAYERLSKLQTVFRGNAFVEYIAEEQLMQVSRAASERLGDLTRQRYAIEVDSAGGFIIRDDANGGVKRPASSLSGGEAFLTSLALALALSAQIQLSGQYPLEFFFLDEGFGTLDQDMLEGVVSALEKLHTSHLSVGVISHVPELRARLPRKLIVHPAEPSGRGSQVSIESI